jgi:transposase InsO family protein
MPFATGPKLLLRDHDGKFPAAFDAVALGAGVRVIRTPVLAPKANAFVERCVGSLRRECLDHVLLLSQGHLQRVLDEYRAFFNASRPHQGIGQRRPASFNSPAFSPLFPCSAVSITTTSSPREPAARGCPR